MKKLNTHPIEELIAIMDKSDFGSQPLICNEYARFYAETCNTLDLQEFGEQASRKFQDRVVQVVRTEKDNLPTVIIIFVDDSIIQMQFGKDGEELISTGMYVQDLHTRTLN